MFSVIIPCFNSEKTLLNTINSVLKQSFTSFEIIVIDDGSTDSTPNIISSIDDKRITYHRISNSGGPAKPRNLGITLAKYEWICFLDSDDIWIRTKLSSVLAYINARPEIDILISGYKIQYDVRNVKTFIPVYVNEKFTGLDLLYYSSPFVTSSLVVKKNKLTNIYFNESIQFSGVEDLDFIIKLLMSNLKLYCIPEILVEYTLNYSGLSKKDQYKHLNNLQYLLHYYYNTKPNNLVISKRKIIANISFSQFKIEFQRKSVSAIFYFFKSMILNPMLFVNWLWVHSKSK